MTGSSKVLCRFPNKNDLSQKTIQHICDLINGVYDEAESGMWKIKGSRTSLSQIKDLLEQKALILAELNGAIVGSVNINLMKGGIGEFGMLVTDTNLRGKGVGSALVKRAEEWAISMNCKTMRLELLTPRTWNHPSKEF